MKSLLIAAFLLLPGALSSLAAQAPVLETGVRVRLRTYLPHPQQGILRFLHPDSLGLNLDGADTARTFRRTEVHRIDVSAGRSRGRGAAVGALIGLAAGFLSGAVLGGASGGGSEESGFAMAVGAGVFGAVGLLTGTLVGHYHGVERWTPAVWP